MPIDVQGMLDLMKTPEGRLLSAAVSAAGAVLSVFGLWWHRRQEKFTWNAQRLFYLHQFLATPHLMNARRALREFAARPDQAVGTDHSIVRVADIVSGAYDQAGILLFTKGAITPRQQFGFLATSWGASIVETHRTVCRIETALRDAGTPKSHTLADYFVHFTELEVAARDVRRLQGRWFGYRRWRFLRWRYRHPESSATAPAVPRAAIEAGTG